MKQAAEDLTVAAVACKEYVKKLSGYASELTA